MRAERAAPVCRAALSYCFFFQAEDGIRDKLVTGVQTCALPISMPARGGDLAILKWISSFPSNPERGLPTVIGLLVVSDATTSEPLALMDAGAVTALRTGAVAAVASDALAAGRSVGIVGCGLHGAWAARCLAAAGYGPGICSDPRAEPAEALAAELGWRAGAHAD